MPLHQLGRESEPTPRRHPRRAQNDVPGSSYPDPWDCPKSEDKAACLTLFGLVENRVTGELRVVHRGCDRWDCPDCGPRRLGQHMAHFRAHWAERSAPLLFVTFHLRPEDHARLDDVGRVHALRTTFQSKLIRRISRTEGQRPRYLAQVDRNGGRFHLHAIIETGLDPAEVAFFWADAGGALDHDIQLVHTDDDLARVAGYVVGGGRFAGTGRLMVTRSLGYGSSAAKAARARYRDERYGAQRALEQFILFEPDPDAAPRQPRPRKQQLPPFETTAPLPASLRSPVNVAGGCFEIVTRLEAGAGRVTTEAVERRVGEPPRVLTAGHSSKANLRRYIYRRTSLLRQKTAGRRTGGEFTSVFARRVASRTGGAAR